MADDEVSTLYFTGGGEQPIRAGIEQVFGLLIGASGGFMEATDPHGNRVVVNCALVTHARGRGRTRAVSLDDA